MAGQVAEILALLLQPLLLERLGYVVLALAALLDAAVVVDVLHARQVLLGQATSLVLSRLGFIVLLFFSIIILRLLIGVLLLFPPLSLALPTTPAAPAIGPSVAVSAVAFYVFVPCNVHGE